MGRFVSGGSTRIFAALALALPAILWGATPARAVVVSDRSSIDPPPGWVGYWNGSSGVPIGPHWFITAKHVAGSVGQYFSMRGVNYRSVEIRQHPTQDLQLVRVAEEFPGFHRLATGVLQNDPAILGGWGRTAGADVTNGFDWTGPQQETWGANRVEGISILLAVRFDAPSNPVAVPHEAIFAVNDSGAGLFTWGADNELELAGVAVSVTNYGSSLYGNVAYALRVEDFTNWILPIIDPGAPISSSVQGPRASSLLGPGVSSTFAGVFLLSAAASIRRRRTRR